jgi:hypothetical protein
VKGRVIVVETQLKKINSSRTTPKKQTNKNEFEHYNMGTVHVESVTQPLLFHIGQQ